MSMKFLEAGEIATHAGGVTRDRGELGTSSGRDEMITWWKGRLN